MKRPDLLNPKKFKTRRCERVTSPLIVGASLLSVGLLAGSGPAHAAMPTLTLNCSAVAHRAVEKAAYYHRYARRHYRRNYYGYGYNYGYHRPYYGYGYHRNYGYNYGYGRRWRY